MTNYSFLWALFSVFETVFYCIFSSKRLLLLLLFKVTAFLLLFSCATAKIFFNVKHFSILAQKYFLLFFT